MEQHNYELEGWSEEDARILRDVLAGDQMKRFMAYVEDTRLNSIQEIVNNAISDDAGFARLCQQQGAVRQIGGMYALIQNLTTMKTTKEEN